MSAPTDRLNDPNSVSFYAPKGPRAVRLGEVSEAAAALAGAPQDGDGRTSRAADTMFEGDRAMLRLRARVSLEPEIPPAPPPVVPRGRSWPSVIGRLMLVIVAAALIALFAIGQLPLPDVTHRQASVGSLELASTSTRPAPAPSKRTEPMVPQLIVQNLRGNQGEPAPLGVRLHGQADGAIVMILGLVSGMSLSAGSAVGANAWQIPVTDLGNAWLIPAADFVGAADLVAELRLADNTIAHRRPIHLEWIASQAAAPAAPATAAASVTPSAAVAAPRQLDRDAIAVLLDRGKKFIAAGDLAAARVVLLRAAEANDAEAALALAATYDPFVLRELKVYGFAADIATARAWYEKARELGSPDAPRRLELLASAAR